MIVKTTVYLPEELKRALESEARRRGSSEAQVIREAIGALMQTPRPTGGFLDTEPFAERAGDLLVGFGER